MSGFHYYRPALRRRILAGEQTYAHRHARSTYILAAILSAPEWVDRNEVRKVYLRAAIMTCETGIKHVVDHIVPLNHLMVCGLSVPWNLMPMTRKMNDAKSNRYYPDQLELTL